MDLIEFNNAKNQKYWKKRDQKNFHLKSNFDWDFESKFIETSIEVDSDFESDFDPKSESTSIEVLIKFDSKSQSTSIASVSLGSESSESFLSILSILRISTTHHKHAHFISEYSAHRY